MLQLPDLQAFYDTVWLIVRQIPYGYVGTYGQIASMIPVPEGVDETDYTRLAPRVVGDAMNAVSSHDVPDIPWHRVVNSKGGISLPVESAAANTQRMRLRAEEITFDMRERIDLATFGWLGPPADWLAAYRLLPPHTIGGPPPGDTTQLNLF